MADKVIEVPGMGTVSFPDTMSDSDISAAIRNTRAQKAKAAFDANAPDLSAGYRSEVVNNTKNLLSDLYHHAFSGEVQPAQPLPQGQPPSLLSRAIDALHNVMPSRPTLPPAVNTAVGMANNVLASGVPGGPQTAGMGFVEGVKNSPLVQTIQNAKVALSGGPEKAIERNIGASGKEAKTVAQQVAPDLAAQDPTLARLKQAVFDQKTFENFQNARAQLQAAEKSIPAGTTVAKAPILADLDQSIDALKVPATGDQFITGHADKLNVLANARNELDKLPDQIPFEDLLKYRRQLDQAIQTHGGWKETASAADQAAMQGKREVANAIRANLGGVSPALDSANKAYGTAADTMTASGLDFDTGRRISTVGKPTEAQQLAKNALTALVKGAAAATGAGGIYGVYHELTKP